MNSSLEWRRSKVLELASQGYNQSEISRILQISQPTINRDLAYLRQQAKVYDWIDCNTQRSLEYSTEYRRRVFIFDCSKLTPAITKEAWNTSTRHRR